MALAMPIHACEHSTFAIGRRAPRGVGVGVGAAAQGTPAGMGLVRRFSRPLGYFFGLWPVVLHGGALFFTTFSRRRVLSPLRSGQRLHLSVKLLRRLIEISKQGRAQPALHIEVRDDTNYRRPHRPVSNRVDTDDRGRATQRISA